MTGDFIQALANLHAQKTRTALTALGMVFGVGSVIGMLSIGAGAREESLRFIEELGVRNVLVEARHAISDQELQQRRRSSQGLTERDVRILEANIDQLEALSPRRSLRPSRVLPKPAGDLPELYGVRPSYATIHNLRLAEGRFLDEQDNASSAAVCVLGQDAKVSLLGYRAAAGKFVKIKYVAQLRTAPPLICFYCNRPAGVATSYRRFLEKNIRQQFGFLGVPLKLAFRKK